MHANRRLSLSSHSFLFLFVVHSLHLLFVRILSWTEFLILDAKDPSKPALCRIPLKHHVPYGFHGTFTPETFVAPPTTFAQTKLPSKL